MNLQILEKKKKIKRESFVKFIYRYKIFFLNFYIKIKNAAINMRYIDCIYNKKSSED